MPLKHVFSVFILKVQSFQIHHFVRQIKLVIDQNGTVMPHF